MSGYTAEQKREAVSRELAFRRRVYARRVAENKMTQHLADFQIGVFEAIERDYQQAEAGERLL
jgi:cell fate (sporulation/competence/biofilm development) regulator YlbF (YheA/YmcA/DUF963 family)